MLALAVLAASFAARAEEPGVTPEPPPKELPPDTLTPVDPPKEGKTPARPEEAKTGEAPKDPKEEVPPKPEAKTDEPPAETVDVNKENHTPGVAIGPKGPTLPPDDLQGLRFMPIAGEIPPGQPAVFVLKGADAFVDGAVGSYILKDESGRQLARGIFKPGDLKKEEGGRTFSVATDLAVGSEHLISLALVGSDDRRLERTAAFRIAHAAQWNGWITLVHAPYPGGHWADLAELGVDGGMAYRMNAERFAELRMAGVPYYVENIARQFLSRYHAERGLWEKTLEALEQNPDAREPLFRAPSLCSRTFAEQYAKELKRHAAQYRSEGPLFYSLAAEPSVTRLAAAYDFDFHPEALAEFRRWLERDAYGTLAALNEYWGTSFKTWSEVVPMTTPEARMRMKDGVHNYAPWCDFRVFQDQTFARILSEGAAALRREDPKARVGITGAMGPFAFGGWDWTRLAGALDVVEAYDIGGARALWRDLAPGKPSLATIPLSTTPEGLEEARAALWNLALDGGPRGALLWDETPGDEGPTRVLLSPEGQPTEAARALAPALRELGGPLGLLLASARRSTEGVAILYSPASVRVNWLFEADHLHGEGALKAWGADTSAERRESLQLRLRESWCKLLGDLGLPWHFVSSAEVEDGVLSRPGGPKALVLPRACALSDKEAEAIRAFAANGGTVVADANCGRFDEHGRQRKQPALDAFFGVDTSREPFVPEPERLLEGIVDETPQGTEPLLTPKEHAALPPPYSDKPLWKGDPPARRCTYRQSPVLAVRSVEKGAVVYLNLALDDYLRWRLHPELPKAAAARALLARLAFQPLLDTQPVDLQASTLPPGTELAWFGLGSGATAVRVLALRRNPQARLHELGLEGDRNDLFAKAEPFKLVLREKTWAADLLANKPGVNTSALEGTLDPSRPALFALRRQISPAPAVIAELQVRAGTRLTLQVVPGPGADQGPRVYGLRVVGPDKKERQRYGAAFLAADGKWTATVPLALNDPDGEWSFVIRDATTGLESKLAVRVEAAR
ncbi:MAG: beta-galactosidase [Planctomycetota bacterium]|nr:beta-galactosidase [Planctomycetota bacterium]